MSGAILAVRSVTAVAPPLTAVVTPVALSGTSYGFGYVYSSEAANVAISGGIPPYSVVWTKVSGATSITPLSQGALSTLMQALINNTTVSGVWKAVVTDAASTVVNSNTFTVTLESIFYPPGVIIP